MCSCKVSKVGFRSEYPEFLASRRRLRCTCINAASSRTNKSNCRRIIWILENGVWAMGRAAVGRMSHGFEPGGCPKEDTEMKGQLRARVA